MPETSSTAFDFSKIFHHEGHVDPRELGGVKELMDPLLRKLKPHFENAEYSLLISDETSGRIPTLIVRHFANTIYRTQGLPLINTFFILGTYGRSSVDDETQQEFLRKVRAVQKRSPLKKALIVTEQIRAGWHVRNIGELLDEAGIHHDIATLLLYRDPKEIQYNRLSQGYKPLATEGEVFYGKKDNGRGMPIIGYLETDTLKGVRHDVEKMNDQDQDKPTEIERVSVIKDPAVRQTVAEARTQIASIATELTEEILQPQPLPRRFTKVIRSLIKR